MALRKPDDLFLAQIVSYLNSLGLDCIKVDANGWGIDHIKPIASFDKNDPDWQYKAFHYTNLQPLWKQDNDCKKARLDWTPAESKYELPERLKVRPLNQ